MRFADLNSKDVESYLEGRPYDPDHRHLRSARRSQPGDGVFRSSYRARVAVMGQLFEKAVVRIVGRLEALKRRRAGGGLIVSVHGATYNSFV